MALAEGETLGGVVPGFVTDASGRLACTVTGSTRGIIPGFVTDEDGRLLVTGDGSEATIRDGFIKTSGGALVVTSATEESLASDYSYNVIPGFLTNEDGAILTEEDAVSIYWQDGFLVSDSGLAITVAGAE